MFYAYMRIHIYLRADMVLCTTIICTKRLIKHHTGAQFLTPLYFASLSSQFNTNKAFEYWFGHRLPWHCPKVFSLHITISVCLKICKSYKQWVLATSYKMSLIFSFTGTHSHSQLYPHVKIIQPHTLLHTVFHTVFPSRWKICSAAAVWATQLRLCFKSVPGHLIAMPPQGAW